MASIDESTIERDLTSELDPRVSFDVLKPPPFYRNILKTARPKQWVKNILVFAAPAAAGRLTEGDVLVQSIFAFIAFLLASVGTYFVNDALDYKSDRLHPKKRWRPVAAGWISLKTAWAFGAGSLVASLALAFAVGNVALGALIAGYVAMTLSYGLWLKHVAIVDLVCVAAGFVLRMIAGGLATDIPISEWFLTVASFSSLFVVAGKRYGEVREVGEGQSATRAVLDQYTGSFLRSAWVMAMTVSIAAYMLWASENGTAADNGIWYQLTAIPWVMALLRYAMLIDRGVGGAPEDVLARDRLMQVLGVVWLFLFGVSVYA